MFNDQCEKEGRRRDNGEMHRRIAMPRQKVIIVEVNDSFAVLRTKVRHFPGKLFQTINRPNCKPKIKLTSSSFSR